MNNFKNLKKNVYIILFSFSVILSKFIKFFNRHREAGSEKNIHSTEQT